MPFPVLWQFAKNLHREEIFAKFSFSRHFRFHEHFLRENLLNTCFCFRKNTWASYRAILKSYSTFIFRECEFSHKIWHYLKIFLQECSDCVTIGDYFVFLWTLKQRCGSGLSISSEYGNGSRSRVLMTKNSKKYSWNFFFSFKSFNWPISRPPER